MLVGAAGLALLAITLDVASHKPSAQQKHYQSECHKAQARYGVVLNNSLEPFSADEDSETGKREEKGRQYVAHWCDLFAQQAAADAARYTATQSLWVTLLTGIGVLLIAGTLVFTKKTLSEAREATVAANKTADIAREIGQKQVRAYISVDLSGGAVFPGMIDRETMNVWAKVRIKNVGSSPAKKISASIFFRFGEQGFDGERAKMVTISRSLAPGATSSSSQSDAFTMKNEFGFFQTLNEPIRAMVIIRYIDVFGEENIDQSFFVFTGGGRLADWIFENRYIVDAKQWSGRPEGAEWQNQSTYDEHRQDDA